MTVLVIDSSPGQHHGVVIGPFRCVTPPLFVAVPEVATGRVTNNAVWETLPHCEGKVNLDRDHRETKWDGQKTQHMRTGEQMIPEKCTNSIEREMINRKWLARTWATFGLKWKHSTSEVWWQSDLCSGKHRVLVQTEYSIGGDSVVGQKAAAYHLVWFGKHKQMWLGERKEQTALLCSWLPNDTVWISLIWAQVRCMCLTDGTNSQCLSCLFVLQSCSSYRVSDSTNTPC